MKVKQFSAFFLVVFFSIFAVSPLSYSCGETSSGEGSSAEKTEAFLKNFNIFLIEIFYSKLTDRPCCSDSVPVNRVFVKKQRVVLRSTEKNQLKLLLCPVISDQVLTQDYPVYAFLRQQHGYKKQSESFVSSFSGLSPPSVTAS